METKNAEHLYILSNILSKFCHKMYNYDKNIEIVHNILVYIALPGYKQQMSCQPSHVIHVLDCFYLND